MAREQVLSPRQRAFVARLVAGRSGRDAAADIGVSERQARRYMADPKVRAALAEAQTDALGGVVRAMNAGSADALGVLRVVMHDKAHPAGVRVRAATVWLDQAFKARELVDLEQRVAILEARITAGGIDCERRQSASE